MYALTIITLSSRFTERGVPTLEAAQRKAVRALRWGYQHGTADGAIVYVSPYQITQVVIRRDERPTSSGSTARRRREHL